MSRSSAPPTDGAGSRHARLVNRAVAGGIAGRLDPPFRVRYVSDGAFAISGFVDLAGHDAFRRVLAILPGAEAPPVTVDATSLTFADHHFLLSLDDWARHRRTNVVIDGGPPILERIAAIVGTERVEIRTQKGCARHT